MSNKLPPKVLVIEPNESRNSAISNAIERALFDVIRCFSTEQALDAILHQSPNVLIISSQISEIDPVKSSEKIQAHFRGKKLAVIFLLEENESEEPYKQYKSEIVDVLHRPFTSDQLMILIRSLLRESRPVFQNKIITYKDVKMDLATYKVFRKNKPIHLGPTEFKILQCLMQSPNVIYSREQIIQYVWGNSKVMEARTVDVHVNRLRSLMKSDNDTYQLIKTVRAVGYCLSLPGEIDLDYYTSASVR